MKRVFVLALCVIATAATFEGCGSNDDSDNGSDSAAGKPEQGFEDQNAGTTQASDEEVAAGRQNAQNPPTGNPKNGAPKEYRVGAELQANFPAGTVYYLEPQKNESCINDHRLGKYGPTTSDSDKSDLWFLASESVLDGCFDNLSFQYWDFHLTKPFPGHQLIFLGQDSVGGSYHTDCPDWVKNTLTCEKPGQLSLKISPEQPSGTEP